MSTPIRVLSVAAVLVAVALLALAAPSTPWSDAAAEGGGTPRPGVAPGTSPAQVRGARFFDQAVSWINDGKPGVHTINTFFCDLHDVQLDVHDAHQEGYLRLWFKAPDKFRQEWRQVRDLRSRPPVTTKILAGTRMWVVSPDGTPRRIHGTASGAGAVQQLQDDRDRLADLAVFLTLEGLKGPGVVFEDLGPSVGPAGTVFQGEWQRVRRTFKNPSDGAKMAFYFAYTKDAAGKPIAVTHPGIVVIYGDVTTQEPTEAYILSNWKKGPQFRYPGKIEALAREDWKPQPKYVRFLLAFPEDIRINPIFNDESAIFGDPMKKPGR